METQPVTRREQRRSLQTPTHSSRVKRGVATQCRGAVNDRSILWCRSGRHGDAGATANKRQIGAKFQAEPGRVGNGEVLVSRSAKGNTTSTISKARMGYVHLKPVLKRIGWAARPM